MRYDADLGLDLFQARFRTYAFARHWHEYYVIGLVEGGAQSFWCRGATFATPRGGLIVLNPGEAHTGEAAIEAGFTYRALYPTADHMARAMAELGRENELPHFPEVRIDDREVADGVRMLHLALRRDATALERETRWLALLTTLIQRYDTSRARLPRLGAEPRAVAQARAYLEAHYAERITLTALAAAVGFSPFHLARVFQRAAGVPPHAYLESVRVRQAQYLLAQGTPPADVAYAVGYSSQSHFTDRFRRIIGVTPGRYQQMRV